MSPAEIARRAALAVRDRTLPPAYMRWSPDQAFERLFPAGWAQTLGGSRLERLVHVPAGAGAFEPVVGAARELGAGRWSVFGHAVRLDDPPRWRRDPLGGGEWPDRPSHRIDYRAAGAPGLKPTWELGRLTMLPTLALAARVTGERAFAEQASRWLADFTRANPLGRGLHHTSGIEMAVRVLTTTWTLALLAGGADDAAGPAGGELAGSLGLLMQQALWCRDHLSLGSSANNHLIGEYAAMAVAGAAFPQAPVSRALLDHGHRGLENETLRQIHDDGVPAEQAFGYLPFVWELLLPALSACEVGGRTVSGAVRGRLRASLDFARAIRLPVGRWPQIGDEDDGRILLAVEGPSRLDLVGNALAAWLSADGLGSEQALALLLVGRPAHAPRAAAEGAHEFARGGLTVWHSSGLTVTFDHGSLGLGSLAAHGHADALAVTIFEGVTPVVLDPGTFAYHEDPAARDRCRGTPGHGTIHFGGRSQSEMLGPFLWGARAVMARRGEAWECAWASGERHRRRVTVHGREIAIEDQVTGNAAELCFTLAPAAEVQIEGQRATVRSGRTTVVFEAGGTEAWRREPGEYAPRFATVVPAPRLCARLAGPGARTVIRVAG